MKKLTNNGTSKPLNEWVFSWSFVGFIIYCMSVVMTIGIVMAGIYYFSDYFFNTNTLSLIQDSQCSSHRGSGFSCITEKLAIKIFDSKKWAILIIPVLITVIGSRKYEKIYK